MIVTVLNADDVPDASGDTFDPNGVLIMRPFQENQFDEHEPLNVVPVFFTNDYRPENVMGKATLFMEGSRVLAEIKLSREIGIPLYPSVAGHVIEKESRQPGKKGDLIKKCIIEKIALTPERNQDPRISPIVPDPDMTMRN